MKIESIIKRDPPTEIDLDGTVYKFQPDEQGRHVVEVTDKHHIARLLSITEGYQLADDVQLPKTVQTELERELEERTAQQPQVLAPVDYIGLRGSTVHPATIDLGDGEQTSIDDVIAEAHQRSGLTTEEWNELPDEVRHNLIDAELDIMAGGEEEDGNPDGQPTEEPKVQTEQVPADTSNSTPPPAPVADQKPAEAQSAEDKAKAEREALADEYKAKFGVKPHYKWTADKIREELAKPAPEKEGE